MKLLIHLLVTSTLHVMVSLQAGETANPNQVLQFDSRLQWWRAARFGLFIHWGPASVNGTEISWSRRGHPFDHPGNETVPAEVYDNLYQRFNPEKFDANAWMSLAKEAGMKYVVFVTKHHDGFSMWPTKLRPEYSMAATPFKRDICKEIADAAHRYGLKLGWYYSTRDWTHPDYLKDGNAKYNDFYHGQVQELLSNYGRVDIMWFDHVAGNWADYRFAELFAMLQQLQPGILVNNRAARFIRSTVDQPSPAVARLVQGDFDTPEQQIGAFQTDRAWESCMTILNCKEGGGWSYRPDCHTRSFEECLTMLVNCAGGDGNCLLNVGPLPSGEIEPQQVVVLKQMGAWLKKHGESIYGTRGGPWQPTRALVSTRKDNTVFVHILHWHGEQMTLPNLPNKVKTAVLLGRGKVRVSQTPSGLVIAVSERYRQPVDTVVKLTLKGSAMEITPLPVTDENATSAR
jgi:alpha-L-fucosidase